MTDIQRAVQMLDTERYTCVLCYGGTFIYSDKRGVKPLADLYADGNDLSGFSAADRVVGKATAFLYLLLGIKRIYARVISRSALELLRENGVSVEYATLAENIINRNGDGICPFEAAVLDISDRYMAYTAICDKMKELNI